MPVIDKVSYRLSYEQFQSVRDRLSKCGLELHYVPESEYDLQIAGIKDPMASKNFPLLREKFFFSHLLIVEIVSLQNAKSSFKHYTEYEKKQQERTGTTQDDLQKTAVLSFKIFSIENMKMIYNLSVETSVNPMVFKDDDNGEQHVNLGSTGMATGKAIKKGIKKITKDCGCSQ